MKFEVYADRNILESILLEDEKYSNWNNILKHHSDVFVNINQDDYDLDISDTENSILFQYIQEAHGKEPIPSEQFFEDFEKDNSIVLDKPFSTYFLEKDDQTVSALSEKFGLIFQNSMIDDTVVSGKYYSDIDADDDYEDGIGNHGWKYLLPKFSKKMNALIVNDPYLFDNTEPINGENVKTGVINLLAILDAVLPKTLGIDFHFLLFTGNDKKEMSLAKAESIYNDISSGLKGLRPYNVIFEMVVCQNTLHRRIIYTNTSVFKSEHGFDMFSERKKPKPKTDNDITIEDIFQNLGENSGEPQINEIFKKIPKIKNGAEKALENIKNNTVYKGERCHGFDATFSIRNRLINHFP